jgi:hypothetical protein
MGGEIKMPKVTIVIRELGRAKPDYSLDFDLPELPRIGDYLSIHRPDKPEPFGEDIIVRRIWWRLEHPETRTVTSGTPKIGGLKEIMVECEPAIGPYSSDAWRTQLERARANGAKVETFEIERVSVRESDLKPRT